MAELPFESLEEQSQHSALSAGAAAMSWGWQQGLGMAQGFRDGKIIWEWQKDLGMAEWLAEVQSLLTTVCTWSSHVKSGGFGSAHGHTGQCQRYLEHLVLC